MSSSSGSEEDIVCSPGSTPDSTGPVPNKQDEPENNEFKTKLLDTKRKPSLGHATSLPLPKNNSTGQTVQKQKSLQRCPTLQPSNRENAGNTDKIPIKRKESLSWTPFGAIGKAVGSGVNLVGSATKAVGSGVVQGTKVVGTGVVSGTKAVGSGMVSGAHAVGSGVVQGTKAVGSGVVSASEAVGNAAVSSVTAVGEVTATAATAVGKSVDDSSAWVKEKRRSVILHTKKHTVHVVEPQDTVGIIAAKYKTTADVIISLNNLSGDGDITAGMEIKVPSGERKRSSRSRNSGDIISMDFLSNFSIHFREEESTTEKLDSIESHCLIIGSLGPLTATQGYLMLDQESLVLSWGNKDPISISPEDINNINLLYGPQEMVGFNIGTQPDTSVVNHHVFPSYNEEKEYEDVCFSEASIEEHSQKTHTEESDDMSLCGSLKNISFDSGPGAPNLDECHDMSREEAKSLAQLQTRRRTISKENRQSLLFDDTMATYVYIELKHRVSSPGNEEPNQHVAAPLHAPVSPISQPTTLDINCCTFVVRVPNEVVVRAFSLLVRYYGSIYSKKDANIDTNGFTVLSMDTLQERDPHGDSKVATVLASKGTLEDEPPIPRMEDPSEILDDSERRHLCAYLPARVDNRPWILAFSTSRDGFSLSTLYRKLHNVESPVLLVIQDRDAVIFGALTSEAPKITETFTGTGESWLFSFEHEQFSIYRWTKENEFFIKGCSSSLMIGAGDGQFGIWFDGDLNAGRTQSCATFNNPPLTSKSDFLVKCIECWAFI